MSVREINEGWNKSSGKAPKSSIATSIESAHSKSIVLIYLSLTKHNNNVSISFFFKEKFSARLVHTYTY